MLLFLVAQMVKNPPAMQETRVQSLSQNHPWRREWLPSPVFLPEESHGQRSLMSYSPWGCKESDTTEQLTLLLSSYKIPEFSSWKRSLLWDLLSLSPVVLGHVCSDRTHSSVKCQDFQTLAVIMYRLSSIQKNSIFSFMWLTTIFLQQMTSFYKCP